MPSGVPVATVAIGAAGAKNAAILAAQILATSDPKIQDKLKRFKKNLARQVAKKAEALREKL
jgi:phosphoribosylcarboxyaminoimidazole (NCAIR) mutase